MIKNKYVYAICCWTEVDGDVISGRNEQKRRMGNWIGKETIEDCVVVNEIVKLPARLVVLKIISWYIDDSIKRKTLSRFALEMLPRSEGFAAKPHSVHFNVINRSICDKTHTIWTFCLSTKYSCSSNLSSHPSRMGGLSGGGFWCQLNRSMSNLTRKPTNWWVSAKRAVTHPTATVVYNTCYHLFQKRPCMTLHRLAWASWPR